MTARRDRRSGRAAAIWHVLVGPPLRARDVSREQITPVEGLSALSLDALTSVAYGPEAILAVLAVAGAGALHLVLPITAAIVALLAILVFSYRQVIAIRSESPAVPSGSRRTSTPIGSPPNMATETSRSSSRTGLAAAIARTRSRSRWRELALG